MSAVIVSFDDNDDGDVEDGVVVADAVDNDIDDDIEHEPPPSKNRLFRKKHQNRVFIIERCSKVSSFRIYITF